MDLTSTNAWIYSSVGILVLVLLMLWSLVWKGLALWRAARNGHTAWYIIMLILNTAGILEIIYYFAVGDKTKEAK